MNRDTMQRSRRLNLLRMTGGMYLALAACSGQSQQSGGEPSNNGEPRDVTGVLDGLDRPGSGDGDLSLPPGRKRPDGVPIAGESTCTPPAERVWQLSPLQIANTMAELIPGADATVLKQNLLRYATEGKPYSSDPAILNASLLFTTELTDTVSRLANTWLASRDNKITCAANSPDHACAEKLVATIMPTAFRRPVSASVRDDFLSYYDEAASQFGAPAAIALLLERMLSAPEVLFRTELGTLNPETGLLELSAHERADLIAFALTDAPPDAELRAAADDGSLLDTKTARIHVDRLLATEPLRDDIVEGTSAIVRKVSGLLRFWREYLDIEGTRYVTTKGADERILRWLDNETMMFSRHAMWEGDGRLQTMLNADYTFYSNTLSDYYGVSRKPDYTMPASTVQGRRGVLMQGAFLTAHHSATTRGKFIRSRLFCQNIPAPATNVDMNLAGLEEMLESQEKANLSPRDVRARHMSDPTCSNCHRQLDPLGFPFDTFDALGKQRTTWDGFPIDTRGEIIGTDRSDGTVADAGALANRLAQSEDVATCFVVQMYMFVHGRVPDEADTCYLQRLSDGFTRSRGDVRPLLTEMLLGDEMRFRMPDWEKP